MIRKIMNWYRRYLARKRQKEIVALIRKLYAPYYKAKEEKEKKHGTRN